MQLASAVASVSVAAPASASVAALVVKGRLEVAQLGRPGQPPVLLAVALPG